MKKRSRKSKQGELLRKPDSFYGGSLRCKRKGRLGPRPLAVRSSMHLVLRSTKAVGERAFDRRRNREVISKIVRSHAERNYIRILSMANVGNHIHLHIQLGFRKGYYSFIRAITAAIAMHVMEWNRWTRAENVSRPTNEKRQKFWDYRPYTNVVTSWTGFQRLREYVKINQFEAGGLPRDLATLIVKNLNPLTEAQDGPPRRT